MTCARLFVQTNGPCMQRPVQTGCEGAVWDMHAYVWECTPQIARYVWGMRVLGCCFCCYCCARWEHLSSAAGRVGVC